MEGIPSVELFSKPQYQKLRERWCAGMFGKGYSRYVRTCEVGINETTNDLHADFFLKEQSSLWPFQIVEVQDSGRKRGDEYKGFADGSIKTIQYSPEKGHVEGPEWLKNGIVKKVNKNYAGSENLNLLVYANFTARQLDYSRLESALEGFKNNFSSIWIITGTHLCSVHSGQELGEVKGWGEVRNFSDYYA